MRQVGAKLVYSSGVMVPILRNLRKLREAKYWTQEDLAKRAGLSRVAIARLESTKVDARFSTIHKLANALGVEPEELVGADAS